MSTELKPCPFCGSKAVVHVNNGVRVVCTACEATTITLVDGKMQGKPAGGSVDKVIELWNRRSNNGTVD